MGEKGKSERGIATTILLGYWIHLSWLLLRHDEKKETIIKYGKKKRRAPPEIHEESHV